MDPNATLAAARTATKAVLDAYENNDENALEDSADSLAMSFQALDEWIGEKQGFLPDAWQRPLVPAYGVNSLVDHFLHIIFTTALEGGIGYWSAALTYHWSIDGAGDESDVEGFHADIVDADDEAGDDNFPQTRIDRSVIARAFERMAAGPVEYMPDAQRHAFLAALHARLAGMNDDVFDFDFDAGDADNVVQVGVLGKVVFG